MVNKPIELVAGLAGSGAITVEDVRSRLPDRGDPRDALFRLAQLGLVFRVAQGRYAVPGKEELSDALALRGPSIRLAAWLHRWLQADDHRSDLPNGLDWKKAGFVGLSLHMHTQLRWEGPRLLVPIEEEAERIEGLHHSVSVFAYDPAHEPVVVEPEGFPALVPDHDDLARVLLVHQDPRLQEAGRKLQEENGRDDEEFEVRLSRTDPPLPFREAKLPRGPPFRYRLFAPRSWVNRNVEHAHPSRDPSEEGT